MKVNIGKIAITKTYKLNLILSLVKYHRNPSKLKDNKRDKRNKRNKKRKRKQRICQIILFYKIKQR